VFSAIQGEGLNVGTRQIFIRFALCDLRCQFCDSATLGVRRPLVESNRPDYETLKPTLILCLLSVTRWIERQNLPGLHDSISLTGGEPLLHALLQFLPQLAGWGYPSTWKPVDIVQSNWL